MAQMYSEGRTDIKGQMLMGSVLLKDMHSINDKGETEFKEDIPPTLTIGAEKDGLMRITRVAS